MIRQNQITLLDGKHVGMLATDTIESSEAAQDARFRTVETLIVKVTHRCNLDCAYCYEHITKGDDMPLAVFKTLAERALAKSTKDRITFVFHGGEPTLMPEFWLRNATEYARKQAQHHKKIVSFSMQSNALALDNSKITLLNELGIKLGVSIDGPFGLPDPLRRRSDVALERVKMAQSLGVYPGILMTINHSNFTHFTEICQWLEREVGVRKFKANVVASVGRGFELPDLHPEQVFEAYHSILEYMIATKGEKVVEENLLLELHRFFSTPDERQAMPAELCRTRHCGAGERVIGITPEGNLLPCGRFQWDDKEYFLGAIGDEARQQIAVDFARSVKKFHDLVPQTWIGCFACKAKDICSYGCQAFVARSKNRLNLDCIPTKVRFAYYEQNHVRLRPVIEFIRQKKFFRNSSSYNDGDYDDRSSGPYNDYSDRPYNDYSDES